MKSLHYFCHTVALDTGICSTSFDRYKVAKSNILITFAVGKVHRDVAQLVARHVRDVEVGSSSLLIPTNKQEDVLSKDLFSTSFLCLLRGGTQQPL